MKPYPPSSESWVNAIGNMGFFEELKLVEKDDGESNVGQVARQLQQQAVILCDAVERECIQQLSDEIRTVMDMGLEHSRSRVEFTLGRINRALAYMVEHLVKDALEKADSLYRSMHESWEDDLVLTARHECGPKTLYT